MWSRRGMEANWEEFSVARCRAQLVYEHAECPFDERSKSFLTNAPNPQK